MSTGSQGPSGASADDWFFEQLDDETLSAFDPDVGFEPDDLAGVEVTTLDITTSEMAAVNQTNRVDAGAVYAGPAYPGETDVGDLYAGSGTAGDAPPTGIEDERARSRPGRLVLGLAMLAAERVRPGPPSDAFLAGVGLLQQGATGARLMVRRAMSPPVRMATRAAGWAAWLPGAETSRRRLSRSRERVGRVVLDARRVGAATVAAGRLEASVLVQQSVSDGLAWAQARAVPQIVDGLVPHLVHEVVPRIIDGALPEIRERVLPIVIQDLATDPQVGDLIREQGMGVVGEAAQHLRTTTSGADDRIESAFRRLVRSPQPHEDMDEDMDGDPDENGTAPGAADNSTDTSHG